MDTRKQRVGKKIREQRKILGFKTQGALAREITKVGGKPVDGSRVSRWETGEEMPEDHLPTLLAVLGKDREWFDEAGAPPPAPTPDASAIFEYVRRLEEENAELKRNQSLSDEERKFLRALAATKGPLPRATAYAFLTAKEKDIQAAVDLAYELAADQPAAVAEAERLAKLLGTR